MSRIEELATELGALTTGVERAQGQAVAAGRQADEVARQAAAAGFAAVATGMAAVRQAITEIHGGLHALGGLLGEAASATAKVPQEGSAQETIAGLAPVRERLDGARDALGATVEQVNRTQRMVGATLQGGQPGPLLSTLQGITQILVPLAQRVGSAKQLAEAAIAQARQLGSPGN
ncbi:DUF6244 family protein [Micromonospora sp. HM5-17]|jgi:hypothetical protein|uniref:DUF6244 family protein n=1 Tax=Micromonospora sp. HM5-17 TaxID=2487710 RepID=UPI000F47C866|nr:DUF6244 family protein [Micromonospora sp. HM5-17]ROT26806.1 hypothetical protein EF879_24585 [Micromonospora sp. HM5-17]